MRGGAIRFGERLRTHVRAHQQHRRPNSTITSNFLWAVQIAAELLVRHALQIAEWLEQVDAEPKITSQPTDLMQCCSGSDQVVFEDLNAIEAGGSDCTQLVFMCAA